MSNKDKSENGGEPQVKGGKRQWRFVNEIMRKMRMKEKEYVCEQLLGRKIFKPVNLLIDLKETFEISY